MFLKEERAHLWFISCTVNLCWSFEEAEFSIPARANVISFKELLGIFFTTHDPTTTNRQGADVVTHCRSLILHHNDEQKATAEEVIKQINSAKIWNDHIVTQVKPFRAFYKAEKYHDKYFKGHPEQPYCRVIIAPKDCQVKEALS